jgi:hypothetical protein
VAKIGCSDHMGNPDDDWVKFGHSAP